MRFSKLTLPLIALLIFTCFQSSAQVVINEYSCANFSTKADDFGKYEDWIEIYNAGSSAVNIGGYYLSDKLNQPTKWMIPAGIILNAGGRKIFYASGRNTSSGVLHTNFKLTQTKLPSEHIVLSDNTGTVIDYVTVAVTKQDQSMSRIPDGSSTWKISTSPTPDLTNSGTNTFTRFAATPTFDVQPGFYSNAQIVTITSNEPSATVRYTLDGSEPTSTSSTYLGPLTISSTQVLKAAAFPSTPNITSSFVQFATYFINVNHTIPVVSVAANRLTDLANGQGALKPYGSIEYFNMSKDRTTAGYGEFNRHGQDSWANDQRSIDFVMKDEWGYNYALQEQLFNLTPRDEFQRVILRAAGDDNYPAAHHSQNAGSAHLRDAFVQNLAKADNLDLDVRVGTKAIIYMNGQYWGVYDLREVPDDHDFTNYYYGQDKYHLQYNETWGGTWAEYGDQQSLDDWDDFRTTVMGMNMTDPGDWDFVTRNLDVKSLADYVIVNSMTVCSDWLNYNTGWWRGLDSAGAHKKWGYILWDNDAVFGFYVNYTGIPDTSATAPLCNVEPGHGNLSDPQNHLDLLMKLRQNPDFNQFYISRYIDLMNTTFSCDNMLRVLDSTVAVIDPEMTAHAARWSGTYSEWRTNVARLRYFIERRCQSVTSTIKNCYSLTGPYPLTVDANPIGTGTVDVNSLNISEFPWHGNYYGGISFKLKANPDSFNDFYFDHWETQGSPVLPGVAAASVELNLSSADSVIAHFVQHTVDIPVVDKYTFTSSIYPTVSDGNVKVDFYLPTKENVSISVCAMNGTEIWRSTFNDLIAGPYNVQLDLSSKKLSAGIYLATVQTKNARETFRIIIK